MTLPVMSTSYKSPQPCGLGKVRIQELAERLASNIGFLPGGDLESVVKSLNGRIAYQDFLELDSSDSGSIQVEPDDSFVISIANHTSKTRDRFTISHELGHFLLHFLLPRTRDTDKSWGLRAARYGSGQTENEANWFAGAFLLPAGTFKERYELLGGDLVDVADHFGVSVSAATVRARELGL